MPRFESRTKVNQRPQKKIAEEFIKTRHTTHWDWDYLPLEDLEALVGNHPQKNLPNQSMLTEHASAKPRKQMLWGCFFILLSLAILSVVLFTA